MGESLCAVPLSISRPDPREPLQAGRAFRWRDGLHPRAVPHLPHACVLSPPAIVARVLFQLLALTHPGETGRLSLVSKEGAMTELMPGAEPFFYEGDSIGCLLLHGSTATR